jgi:outer membrane protein assembly factor BamD (BamD/ComL family)
MRCAAIMLLACTVMPLPAQQNVQGPASEKAQKTYKEALDYLKKRMVEAALDSFKKADKQDGAIVSRARGA